MTRTDGRTARGRRETTPAAVLAGAGLVGLLVGALVLGGPVDLGRFAPLGLAADPVPRGETELTEGRWSLRWGDEFDGGTVGPDWNVRDDDHSSNEASHLLRANVEQQGGTLRITARRQEAGGRQFTSGYVDTIGTVSSGVGTRWEARIRVPTRPGTSAGLWPAFWLRSDQGGGEIDVAEWYGDPHPELPAAAREVQHVVHEDTYGAGERSGTTYPLPDGALPSDDFHVYAVEVMETGVHFFVDGVRTHAVLVEDHPWVADLLDDTWNIRVNLQVGLPDSYASAPDGTTDLPAVMEVDHVRVFVR